MAKNDETASKEENLTFDEEFKRKWDTRIKSFKEKANIPEDMLITDDLVNENDHLISKMCVENNWFKDDFLRELFLRNKH